jgi:predicted adenylyl cyclase CyaB
VGRNVEIKARVDDLDAMEKKVAPLADSGPTVILQDDTFFHCPRGRLKLRAFADGQGELIAYERPDSAGIKTSTYSITPVADSGEMITTLAESLGVVGRVRKERRLYLIGPTRIHLDRVEGLGTFLELEVVLTAGQTSGEGDAIAADLMTQLGVGQADLISGAYLDLLSDKRN